MSCPTCGQALTCPTHGTPLVVYCAHCRASTGGKARSAAKLEAAKLNLARGRAAKENAELRRREARRKPP